MKRTRIACAVALLGLAACERAREAPVGERPAELQRDQAQMNPQEQRSATDPTRTTEREPTRGPGEGTPSVIDTPPSGGKADDTARNARDRKTSAKTPVDQSNKPDDLKITQIIRKAVIADETLSSDAKNVKIITTEGLVTLRGPVKTDAERLQVESKAKTAPGVKLIDNQIEVEGKSP